ncbi:flagellar hook capping protein [Paucibacter sp. KBW04]|uniref:flagellar hook assembly protein FlgD n=1 Tax=Paucibacter sp. KBW04 TaxID=2153361 RepID=UPI000F55FB5A|nr:flagellar hook capping FlgD N-terminal domain-containing protein [Paucibacter sp. KBW04]RQO63597.1 flagellar hook capping protein [Paucibacter sp. KBW04]
MATNVLAASPVNIQDFLRILVAQLNNQDPLKPLDNQEFVTQLAQFTSLQQTQNLDDKLGQLLSVQGSMQSVGLLGRQVTVGAENGTFSGKVTALNFVGGEPRLTVTLDNGSVMTDIGISSLVTVK